MRSTTYLLWRAAVAIVLMVAFYGLALVAAAALAAFPLLMARVSVGLAFKAAIFCFVGAFLILKAVVPRRDHFEPPGPRLDPATQPRLFAEIRRTASATRQAEPADVFLLADVNAFVTHRGGLMGLGSRRVMGLGLPLLQSLTVPELRAVLAHEFGHLDGTWDEVGTKVWLPDWEKTAAKYGRHLEGLTPVTLPGFDWERLGRRLTGGQSDAQPLHAADSVVGVALAVALSRVGFTVDSTPGLNATLVGRADRIEPFGVRERLASGPEAVAAWQELCTRVGIADIDLGSQAKTRAG